MRKSSRRVIVALDTSTTAQTVKLVRDIRERAAAVKLGLEFFCAQGPAGVREVVDEDVRVFLDLKLHDIPNTVAGAIRSILPLHPFMLTVHTAGGAAMMKAAAAAANDHEDPPAVVGVTALTSLDESDLAVAGVMGSMSSQVLRLAESAQEAGLAGIVCSASEAAAVRSETGSDFLIVVPGIRPAGSSHDDQKRVATPEAALAAGADFLVVGRTVTADSDPGAALKRVDEQIASANS